MVIHTKLYNSEVVPTKFDLIAKHFSLEEPKQV